MKRFVAGLAMAIAFCFCAEPCLAKPDSGSEFSNPAASASFPEVRDWKSLVVTLYRSTCFGACPAYIVQVRGDGTVRYRGDSFVAVPGRHSSHIPQAAIRELVAAFAENKFFSLHDRYIASTTDMPRYGLSISYDGRTRQVFDYDGDAVGMPKGVTALERLVDSIAQTRKWVDGDATTVPALKSEGWNFRSQKGANLELVRDAAGSRNAVLVKDLLAAGAPVSGKAAEYGCEAISVAADAGDLDMVRTLAASPAPIHIQSPDAHCDALHFAAQYGSPEILRLILARHPDVNWNHPGDGRTAIFALQSPQGERRNAKQDIAACAKLLVAAGADIDARDDKGNTALMYADTPQLALALLEASADPTLKNADGRTAYWLAKSRISFTMIAFYEKWTRAHPQRPAK